MKRSVLLSLTGITSLTLLFLSAAHASPELRDMPHKGGANAQINTYTEDLTTHDSRAELQHEDVTRSSCTQRELQWESDPAPQQLGPTIVVQADGSGDVGTIRDALLVAEPGDTILLGPGTYRGIGSRQLVIEFGMARTIRSMAGPEQTIIDGEGAEQWAYFGDYFANTSTEQFGPRAPVVLTEREQGAEKAKKRSDGVSARRVLTSVNPAFQVEGITLQNFSGEAAYASYTYVLLRNCIVRRCQRGLGSYAPGDFILESCLLEDNLEAMYLYGVSVSGCVIRNNGTGIAAGGMVVSNSDIVGNGLGLLGGEGNIIMSGCRIIGNGYRESSPSGDCGGILLWDTTIRMTDNLIMGNHAGAGGGIAGDFRYSTGIATVFRNNILVGNTADVCGGALYGDFDLDIENNTFVGNHAPRGSVIAFKRARPNFKGNILALNSGGDPFVFDDESTDPSSTATLQGNDIFGNDGDPTAWTSDGGGNFSADPWFCDADGGDYTLREGSLCLAENSPTGKLVGALGLGCGPLTCDVRFHPGALNPKGRDSMTAVLTGDIVPDIDPATVRLNGDVAPLDPTPAKSNGRLTLDFDAAALLATLVTDAREQTITLTAQLANGMPVRAADTVRLAGGSPHATQDAEEPTVVDGINTVTPNPFNPVTRIRYGVTAPGRVTLVVYNVAGRRVVTLVDSDMPTGTHQATWSADNTASGIYFARLTTPTGSWTRKLVVLK